MSETWKDIPGFEGRYEVSDLGRIRSIERTNLMKYKAGYTVPRKIPAKIRSLTFVGDRQKYLGCLLIDNAGRKRCVKAHVAVLETFIGPRPSPAHDGCHGDGDVTNNTLSNLRWDTKSGNNLDKKAHGTAQVGSKNGASKLDEVKVRAIKARLPAESMSALAREFGVSVTAIWQIKTGKKWQHV